MEYDLIYALILMTTASLGAIWIGRNLARHLGSARMPLFALVMLLTSFYASAWVGRIENVAFVPISSVVLISNLTPILVSFLAGFAWGIPGVPSLRRGIALSAMIALGGVFLLAPLLRPALRPVNVESAGQWSNGLCLQTHEATCAPAAAATLLHHHGIDVTEPELAAECLTSREGTEPLALYRCLRKRTRGVGLTPQLASRRPDDWMKLGQFPLLAMVDPSASEFSPSNRSSRLRQLLGKSGEGHAVVIFGRDSNGDYLIGDPATGFATWDPANLSWLFSGQAIYLQRRDG